MGPFWRPGQIVKGGFQNLWKAIWIFLNFHFFSFLWKHQLKRKKNYLSQSYLVTLKEAEKDKDERERGWKQFLFLYAGEGSIFRPFLDFRPGLPASDRVPRI